jgi:hypothetical protein
MDTLLESRIETKTFEENANKNPMVNESVEQDVGIQLDREELYGYLYFLGNNSPTIRSKTQQLVGLDKRMLDDTTNKYLWILTSHLVWRHWSYL